MSTSTVAFRSIRQSCFYYMPVPVYFESTDFLNYDASILAANKLRPFENSSLCTFTSM